jgi:gamma-glutamyltranspeptidase/glutathione hydrolase
MLWLEEGLASSLRPRTRPRTTLSPSLALRDGEPCLAFGTPGGDAQDQWTLQFFLAHARFGLDLQEAIDAPSFQSDHFPSSFWPRRASPGKLVVEAGHDPAAIAGLRERGHLVKVADPWTLGRTCAAGRDPATGFLLAAANPRGRQAYAVGR